MIHLNAGTAAPNFQLGKDEGANAITGGEWNVALDPIAFVRLLRSDLPIALYPCATQDGAFAYGPHNTFWRLPNLHFVKQLDRRLRNYMDFAFGRAVRMDFLRAMDEEPPPDRDLPIYEKPHSVWETAVWMKVTGRRLVRRADGKHKLVSADELLPTDTVLPSRLRPARVQVRDDGRFLFELTDTPTNLLIFDRGDPHENERALREALPDLYLSIRPPQN